MMGGRGGVVLSMAAEKHEGPQTSSETSTRSKAGAADLAEGGGLERNQPQGRGRRVPAEPGKGTRVKQDLAGHTLGRNASQVGLSGACTLAHE